MRVVIEVDVAADPTAFPWLNRIMHLFEDGWHLWEIGEGDEMLKTSWLMDHGRLGESAREMFKKSLARSAYPARIHRQRITISRASGEKNAYSPESAARFLAQPLVILVENRMSDGKFLDAIVETIGSSELRRYWLWEPPPVRIDSLGGKGQMNDHIKREAQKSPKPRLFVLRDGDGTAPGCISADAEKLKANCDRLGLSCWILSKREAENYLPGSLLARVSGKTARGCEQLAAWRRLNEDQKDFYDVRSGLNEMKDVRQELFRNLNEKERSHLAQGFGKAVSELWAVRPLEADELRARAGRELDQLLDLICQQL